MYISDFAAKNHCQTYDYGNIVFLDGLKTLLR